jgi:autotransporter-associated beta strand protein
LQIDSGAAVNLTGAYAANNINRTFAGLTGSGVLYGGGGTVTVNKATGTDTFTGDIQGAQGLVKSGGGDLALGGASSYTGTTTVNAGRLVVAHGNALGGTAGGTTVANGAQLMLTNVTVGNEALTLNGVGLASGSLTAGALRSIGTNTYQGKITLGSDARIFGGSGTSLTLDVASGEAVDLASHTLTIDGAGASRINDAIVGTGGLIKSGSGKNTLAGANTYSGATAVNAGTLEVVSGGSISSSATTVNSGGTLEGSGTVSALSIASGGTLAPGNSTGILNAGSTTFASGGNYKWEIDTFGGVVGNNWDFLNITGDLTISATSGSKFIIDVISLLASSDTAGLATNFNDASNYSFAIATASGSISGYGSDVFNINTSGFQNAFTGTWGTSLSNDGKSLNLTYTAATAIPEPSIASMLVLGLAAAFAKRRRKIGANQAS